MALKIKKVILNDKGQVVEELEGTEAEIEAYEKKQSKKNESVQKKRELLKDQIQRMVSEEVAKIPRIEHHHYTTITTTPAPSFVKQGPVMPVPGIWYGSTSGNSINMNQKYGTTSAIGCGTLTLKS